MYYKLIVPLWDRKRIIFCYNDFIEIRIIVIHYDIEKVKVKHTIKCMVIFSKLFINAGHNICLIRKKMNKMREMS